MSKKFPWILMMLVIILLVVLLLAKPRTRETAEQPAQSENSQRGAEEGDIVLAFQKLGPLAQGHFEGWLVFDNDRGQEEYFSFGKFNISPNGGLVDLSGLPLINRFPLSGIKDAYSASRVAITIEAAGDLDSLPSKTEILSGRLSRLGLASLSFEAASFAQSSGQYILGTPTNDSADDEASGVWFAKQTGADPDLFLESSLVIPPAPVGWRYEGWAVHQNTYLSTGRFSQQSGRDESAPFSGPVAAPSFPGEDFLNDPPKESGLAFPIDLTDGQSLVVISLEPDLEGVDPTGADIFQLRLFNGSIAREAKVHTAFDLFLDTSSLPGGQAVLQ